MDLRSRLLTLLAPLRIGEELLPGVRLTGASEELGLRLSFTCRGADLHVELAPAEEKLPFAVRTPRFKLSYRAGTGLAAVDPQLGFHLRRAVAARIAPQEDAVLEALAQDVRAARETLEGSTRVREVRVERLLEAAGGGADRFYTLSPYVGCLIGCRFCYAQSRVGVVRRLQQLPEVPWGSYVDVRVNAAEVLARELEVLPARPVKFCPIVSDPYQAVEKRYGVTRACLEVLARAKKPTGTLLLTRSRLIERDAALIAALPRGYAGCSIPTADDAVRAHFEPRGAPVAERFAALAALRDAGARTFAVVQPLLPGPLEALADALAAHVTSVRIDGLHGVEGAAAEFADPRYAYCTEESWQRERGAALAEALRLRGVALWPDELPPELQNTAAG